MRRRGPWRTGEPGTPRRLPAGLALAVLGAGVAVAAAAAAGHGAVSIAPGDMLRIWLGWAGVTQEGVDAGHAAVLLGIRLPRVVFAALTGAGLAVAGAAMQGLFRNPLADPALIGVSSGAALAAASVIVAGALWAPGLVHAAGGLAIPAAAFLGGLAATVLVYRIAYSDGHASVALMLLAGVAVNALAWAGIGWFTFLADDEQLRNLAFWNLGSLGGASWRQLAIIAPPVMVGCAVLLLLARPLNALLLGEREAAHLGVDVQRLKTVAIGCAALVVGALVAFTGVIGFIGLVAPHMVRLMAGPDHRVVLPASALLGAILVIAADLAARTWVAPAELPIGVLTAFIGAPFFLGLLAHARRSHLAR